MPDTNTKAPLVRPGPPIRPATSASPRPLRSARSLPAALLQLCRLYYALPLGFTLALTIVYARDTRMSNEWTGTIAASVALALVVAAGYVFNDVRDWRTDRINAPQRPIAAEQVSLGVASVWAGFLLAVGLMVAALACRPAFIGLLAAVAGGLFVYDVLSKRIGLGKQLLVAVLMTSIYPLAIAQSASLSNLDPANLVPSRAATLLFFPLWLFLTAFAYEILKDIRDLHGDQLTATRPNWIAHHPNRARRIASVATIAGAVVLVAPAWAGCGTIYISIIPAAMAAAVISTRLPLRSALAALYLECVLVGIAATADLLR